MNYVGKIFVVLIAILSLVFATMAVMIYASHTNYRAEILRTPAEVRGNEQVGWKYQLTQARELQARLNEEIRQLSLQFQQEKAAKIQSLAKAEATISLLSGENQNYEKENTDLRSNLTKASTDLKATQDNLSKATDEVKQLRTDIAAAHNETDKQIKRATELTDKLTQATFQLEQLTERNQQLATDVGKAKRLLTKFGATLQDPEIAQNIPVEGKITEVSRSRVQLSIGEDDGVRKGQNLDIYRSGKYVGRVRVVESRPDSAVAAIETEFQQFPILRGDNVTSRL
ncbi:MAG: hypothetical protein IT427_13460 [Pirellulales bacterium]|nr:hypothetical protein [Pirellulales bacterium]